jgi:hypothetical protein
MLFVLNAFRLGGSPVSVAPNEERFIHGGEAMMDKTQLN